MTTVNPSENNNKVTAIQQLEDKALTTRTSFFDPVMFRQIKELARIFYVSQAIPQCWNNEAKIIVGLQAGAELGMSPIESLNSLYVVSGAVNIYGKALVKRFREHGWSINYEMTADEGGTCKATVTRGDESYTETLSFKSAEKSGYTHAGGNLKVGWREGVQRNLKLRYGALNIIARTYIPEVLGSIKGIQEVDEDIVDAEVIEEPKQKVEDNVIQSDRIKELKNAIVNNVKAQNVVVTPKTVKVEVNKQLTIDEPTN